MSSNRSTPAILDSVRALLRRLSSARLLAAGGAVALAAALAVGAGATPSPVEPISEVLGLGGDRGAAVSQAAHDAKATAEEEGSNVGAAVSTAVCETLKNTGDLPEPARDAPGHVNQEERDCTHHSELDEEEASEEGSEEEPDADIQSEHEGDNHGAAVSAAAHDAKAAAKEAEEKVGSAVSQAVCEVNQAKELPEGAQAAPGHNKDCTHLSNAGTDSADAESESGSGRGKESAPGQLKKQGD